MLNIYSPKVQENFPLLNQEDRIFEITFLDSKGERVSYPVSDRLHTNTNLDVVISLADTKYLKDERVHSYIIVDTSKPNHEAVYGFSASKKLKPVVN